MDFPHRVSRHFGEQQKIDLPGVTLSIVRAGDTGDRVDWHCHQDPHFTLILQGNVIEGTQREVHNCSAGTLLFHGRFEPHYNVNLESTRCLHLGFGEEFFDTVHPDNARLQGIFTVPNASIKLLCYKVFKEAVLPDDVSPISIHSLSLQILGQLFCSEGTAGSCRPLWVSRIEEILRCEYPEKLTLADLSRELSIHPVHLSRSFSQYFHCTLGEYIRNVRVERSLALMPSRKFSLTEIAFDCGFADQSHFSRSFRQIIGVTPSIYRKLVAH